MNADENTPGSLTAKVLRATSVRSFPSAHSIARPDRYPMFGYYVARWPIHRDGLYIQPPTALRAALYGRRTGGAMEFECQDRSAARARRTGRHPGFRPERMRDKEAECANSRALSFSAVSRDRSKRRTNTVNGSR